MEAICGLHVIKNAIRGLMNGQKDDIPSSTLALGVQSPDSLGFWNHKQELFVEWQMNNLNQRLNSLAQEKAGNNTLNLVQPALCASSDHLDRLPRRLFLVFLHNFKSAGTTINWILYNNFGNKLLFVENKVDSAQKWLSHEQIINYICDGHVAITSHELTLPPASCLSVYKFMMVRDPIERHVSAVLFKFKRIQDTCLHSLIDEYVDQMRIQPWNANLALHRLGAPSWLIKPDANEDDIHSFFKATIARGDVLFGSCDLFNDSMILVEQTLSSVGFYLDCSYPVSLNVCAIAELRSDVASRLIQRGTNEMSRPDAILNGLVRSSVQAGINGIHGIDEMRAQFYERCHLKRKFKAEMLLVPPGPENWTYV